MFQVALREMRPSEGVVFPANVDPKTTALPSGWTRVRTPNSELLGAKTVASTV
jgi:hypothetical protein